MERTGAKGNRRVRRSSGFGCLEGFIVGGVRISNQRFETRQQAKLGVVQRFITPSGRDANIVFHGVGVGGALEDAERDRARLLPTEPTCRREPNPHEMLPPRKTRTKLLWTAKRTPHPNWICDTPIIES
jgi:hypothetical protein